MILSAALDKSFVFLALIAIITSVVGAGYYLNLVKQIFFNKSDYKKNPSINYSLLKGYVIDHSTNISEADKTVTINFKPEGITINSGLSVTVSIITLLLLLFIVIPEE